MIGVVATKTDVNRCVLGDSMTGLRVYRKPQGHTGACIRLLAGDNMIERRVYNF